MHQMQMYYRLGEFDNCSDKWSALTDCLVLKTKRSSEVQVRFVETVLSISHVAWNKIQSLIDRKHH